MFLTKIVRCNLVLVCNFVNLSVVKLNVCQTLFIIIGEKDISYHAHKTMKPY